MNGVVQQAFKDPVPNSYSWYVNVVEIDYHGIMQLAFKDPIPDSYSWYECSRPKTSTTVNDGYIMFVNLGTVRVLNPTTYIFILLHSSKICFALMQPSFNLLLAEQESCCLTKSPFKAGVPEYGMRISSPWLAHTANSF